MADAKVEALVLEALEREAAGRGLDIVSVEVSGPAAHPTLRVRIDELEGGPIDMERVTAATPWVSEVVEALDPFPGAYELEVSSPGIERPLRRARDFAAHLGARAEVVAREPVDGRRSWIGEILASDEGSVTLGVDGRACAIPLDLVRQARLKPDFDAIMAAAKKAEKKAGKAQGGPSVDEGAFDGDDVDGA